MTAKEHREFKKLQNRIEVLEAERVKMFNVYREYLFRVVELETNIKDAEDALIDALASLRHKRGEG